jgi:hypothetical protein
MLNNALKYRKEITNFFGNCVLTPTPFRALYLQYRNKLRTVRIA